MSMYIVYKGQQERFPVHVFTCTDVWGHLSCYISENRNILAENVPKHQL